MRKCPSGIALRHLASLGSTATSRDYLARNMKRIHYTAIVGAAPWLTAALWLVFSNATGRDVYPVGTIAKFLDEVPSVIGTPIFILLWIVFLLGWLVPLVCGVSPLFRRPKL